MASDPDLAPVATALVERLAEAIDALGLTAEEASARIGWTPERLRRVLDGEETFDDIWPLLGALRALGCGVVVRLHPLKATPGAILVASSEEDG